MPPAARAVSDAERPEIGDLRDPAQRRGPALLPRHDADAGAASSGVIADPSSQPASFGPVKALDPGLLVGSAPFTGRWGLSEGEDVRFDARVEECDLERAVRDRPGLAHQLIEPWLDQRSPALLVDVQPMGRAGRCAVDQHAE